jgi:hypothetical protein
VFIHSKSASSYIKPVNVVSVDDAKKELSCKFGGAISGEYTVEVKHKTLGRLDSRALMLKVESQTTAINKKSVSVYGGSLLTLTGTNWGTEATDNPVEIYWGSN